VPAQGSKEFQGSGNTWRLYTKTCTIEANAVTDVFQRRDQTKHTLQLINAMHV